MQRRYVVSVVWVAVVTCALYVLILTACSGEPCDVCDDCADGGSEMVCTPGESQACVCPDASNGAQVCNEDGSGFGECLCESADGDADADADGDADVDADAYGDVPDCPFAGEYLLDGEVAFCHGCEWSAFSGEVFVLEAVPGGALLTFDGFTHGPLTVDESSAGRCVIHGEDSWERGEYVQGSSEYAGEGTYHLNIEGGSLRGLFSWIISEWVDGESRMVDCEVTYHLTGERI